MKTIKLFTFLLSALVLTSCSNDEDDFVEQPLGAYDNGVLVLNEGNFGTDNSTISFISDDFQTLQANAFGAVNNTDYLGNTGQSIGFYNDLAFVVMNGSNKIEIINRYSLEHITTISSGFSNPRHIAFVNGKGYVTNWGDGGTPTDDFIAVVNLSSNSVESTISVPEGPEKIIEFSGNLYVAHQGGYGFGNTISIIDSSTNTVTSSISVGDVPNSMFINNNTLYVMCGGLPSWSSSETNGELNKINLNDHTVSSINFTTTEHPSNLTYYNDNIYYTIDSSVYKMDVNATDLPSSSLIDLSSQGVYGVYALAVNNYSIFIGDAKDYSSNGAVYVYSTSGIFEQEFEVGIIPNGFYFN